jgi:hypothetical protein
MNTQTQTQVQGNKITVVEWSGPGIYDSRYTETRIYDMSLNVIPARQGGNKNVVVWDLEPGKYMLLYIEYPTIISPSFDYVIMCLNVEAIGAGRIEKIPMARVSLPGSMDQKLRENIILTLMRQLQTMC